MRTSAPSVQRRAKQRPRGGLFLAVALTLAMAACRGQPTAVLGETPSMVTVCTNPHDPWQHTLDIAEASCAKHGLHAVQILSDMLVCRPRHLLTSSFECKAD